MNDELKFLERVSNGATLIFKEIYPYICKIEIRKPVPGSKTENFKNNNILSVTATQGVEGYEIERFIFQYFGVEIERRIVRIVKKCPKD